MYACINPRYTPTRDLFSSVDEFQAMWMARLGSKVEIRKVRK